MEKNCHFSKSMPLMNLKSSMKNGILPGQRMSFGCEAEGVGSFRRKGSCISHFAVIDMKRQILRLLYSIRMYKVYFNISIIHVNCSMHILPPPALRHKDGNLQPAPVLDLTVFYKRPDWYLM